ncbi:hypothetical protein ASD79_11535 [Caulobacter sp. Root655]|uniref:hypothetical protein n=1 Tax=Caulobacter sp. Root655 TaxID=1736578 RepID=UPI0006FF5BA2|nr:hypothetical protein [Caulobacter sp. Root655]KRA59316.1 hypothetical protein ASD79_11535 [Caulobacter sp. Root655]
MVQDAVKGLLAISNTLSDDLRAEQLDAAVKELDALAAPLSEEDVRALLSLLPQGGDTAFGLNWTVLHAIESALCWPLWDTLQDERSEWTRILRLRLANAGLHPPQEGGSAKA